MATNRRYVPLDVTTAATTFPDTSPQTTDPALGDVWMYKIELRIPSGHAGLTGIAITYAGVTIVPWSANLAWILGDNDYLTFDVNDEVGQSLRVVTYNDDVISHTHHLRFVCVPISQVIRPATTSVVAVF
ncbi:MAG: hypothetical protein ACRDUW_05005 [Pseudonocardiaceae bacterium]